MLGRGLLALAALILIGTAVWHGLGGTEAAGWLRGERGVVVQALWFVPTLDWTVIASVWLGIAVRGTARSAPIVWLLALVPFGAAALIAGTLGPAFLTMWLLAGAALFAVLGGMALPKVKRTPPPVA